MAAQVQSVARAFAVLRVLAAHPGPLSLAAIAEETELPKSTVSRLLATLEAIAMVERGPDPGTYALGAGIAALAGGPTSIPQLVAVAQPYLIDLVERYGEDAGLAVPDGREVLFVRQVAGLNPVQVRDWTSQRYPAHAVAPGQVIMASWPDEQVEAYLAEPLDPVTPNTVTDPDRLRERVQDARRLGYAWAFGDWAEGITGVAAPVQDPDGALVSVVNLYGPSYRFPGTHDAADVGDALVRAAAAIAQHLVVA